MSVWSTVGGLFTGDTYFPDNPNRQARAQQLARDCQNYAAQLAALLPRIQADLRNLNAQLAALYGSPASLPATVATKESDFAGITLDVSQLLVPLLAQPAISSALSTAATSYLVSAGEIGPAALVDMVGLPAAFEVAIGTVASAAAIVISLGIGALEGAHERSELQSTIRQGVGSRMKLAKAYLTDSQLESSIQAIQGAIRALSAASAPTEKIIASVSSLVSAARSSADAISDADAAAMLAQLDGSRQAWTVEDQG